MEMPWEVLAPPSPEQGRLCPRRAELRAQNVLYLCSCQTQAAHPDPGLWGETGLLGWAEGDREPAPGRCWGG